MKPPLSPSYKFEKEEGGEGLEEEEGEAAPPAMIPGSATACTMSTSVFSLVTEVHLYYYIFADADKHYSCLRKHTY